MFKQIISHIKLMYRFSLTLWYSNYSTRRRLDGGDEGAPSPEPEGEADRESGQS